MAAAYRVRNGLIVGAICLAAGAAFSFSSGPRLRAQPAIAAERAAPRFGGMTAELLLLRDDVRRVNARVEDLIELLEDPPRADPEELLTPNLNGKPWDLSLPEVVRIALANSKTIRNLGGVTPFGFPEEPDVVHVARINTDVSRETLHSSLQNLLNDLEQNYWALWLKHRQVEIARELRAAAQEFWEMASRRAKRMGQRDEAQAREQYFFARSQVQATLTEIADAEHRLRFVLGLAPADWRCIRPTSQPELKKPAGTFAPPEVDDSAELRAQARRIDAVKARVPASLAAERSNFLSLRREEARLEDMLVSTTHLWTSSWRAREVAFATAQSHHSRFVAAREEVADAVALFQQEIQGADIVLDAQRRMAQAQNDLAAATAAFAQAECELLWRQGTLLARHGIALAGDEAQAAREAAQGAGNN